MQNILMSTSAFLTLNCIYENILMFFIFQKYELYWYKDNDSVTEEVSQGIETKF